MADYLPEIADSANRQHNTRIVELLRAAATMIENAGDLPEVMSIGVTEREISIQPWLPGAPVQAMRAFEALMTGPIDRKAFPLVLSGAEHVSMLHSSGQINGQPVIVTAATHRDTPVDGFLGVTEQTMAALAEAETPIADPADDLVLAEMLDERADTRYDLVAEALVELGEPAKEEE